MSFKIQDTNQAHPSLVLGGINMDPTQLVSCGWASGVYRLLTTYDFAETKANRY